MLLKTKLLISLGSVGVVGGTGAGVYYGVIKDKDEKSKDSTTTQSQTAATAGKK